MANEKRLIDANGRYTLHASDNTDYSLLFRNGIICVENEMGHCVCEFYAEDAPTVDAVEVEKYKALMEMYHDLRENFIDYVCSGTCNVAPYCLNRCEGCVDRVGWCSQGSDECHGFNPAEIII